jgi:hypothetical protein
LKTQHSQFESRSQNYFFKCSRWWMPNKVSSCYRQQLEIAFGLYWPDADGIRWWEICRTTIITRSTLPTRRFRSPRGQSGKARRRNLWINHSIWLLQWNSKIREGSTMQIVANSIIFYYSLHCDSKWIRLFLLWP